MSKLESFKGSKKRGCEQWGHHPVSRRVLNSVSRSHVRYFVSLDPSVRRRTDEHVSPELKRNHELSFLDLWSRKEDQR